MTILRSSFTLSDLRPGFKFHQYQLLEQIGAGGQGVVWSAEDPQRNDIAAIKFDEIEDSIQQQVDDEMFGRQLEKLLKVQHVNILQINDCGKENLIRYVVSPYISGGSLFEKIKQGRLPLEDALRFSTEIASALDYLHGQQIIHRDIKSSNILLSLGSHTFLADFGLARTVSATTQALHTGRGTPVYAPPEQHKRLVITPKSDVYSFGILLFELFTGQLPWGGESMLGLRQLYSDSELQDPCELNNTLPPLMKDVLRRVTSADPARRPSSAAEVMKMIYYIFNINEYSIPGNPITDRTATRAYDVNVLFDQNFSSWTKEDGNGELSLTKFALIHLDYKIRDENLIRGGVGQFLLFHALKYGHKDEYWWSRVVNSKDRLSVCCRLLTGQNEVVADRILDHLVKDQDIRLQSGDQFANVISSLLKMAAISKNPELSRKLLSGLQVIIPSGLAWGNSILDSELHKLFGELAIEDSDLGDQAAQVVGHLRSQSAVNFILKNANKNRLIPALLEVQQSAGNLPSFVPGKIRLRVSLEWIARRLILQPARLVGAYMLALLGATLGIGSQVYLTYRLPEFMDVARVSSSLEQGLIVGTVFSMGLFLARVIVERFSGANALLRIVLGSVIGAIGMNFAFFIFHVLFINTPPTGILITLGCLLIALAFAVGGLIRLRVLRMLLSIGSITLAITGTWWVHVTMTASITKLTPLFYYDSNWTMPQVLFTSTIVALWIGMFGNLVSLGEGDLQAI
jgi:serine/threonine protein kinase